MDKRFAIFDMDGTLVDSMAWWDQATVEYLHSRGMTDVPQELLERTAPLPMMQTLELFVRECGLNDTPERAWKELYAIMEGHYLHDVPLKSGADAYLERLARRGVAMCVASSTPEKLMRACLQRLGVLELFRFVLSCDSVGAGKNRPDVYHAAAKRLGAPGPAETAVFEDAFIAAHTAKSAGYYLVGVYDESGADRWPELQALADETIEHWE